MAVGLKFILLGSDWYKGNAIRDVYEYHNDSKISSMEIQVEFYHVLPQKKSVGDSGDEHI